MSLLNRAAPAAEPERPEVPGPAAQWVAAADVIGRRGGTSTTKPSPDPVANTWTCFRKTFTLDELPASAPARIAVDSKYWLWVNGQLIIREGGLKRGPNREDTYFDTVDLAPFLVPGENTVAALAWYFGKEGFSHISSGTPGFYVDAPGIDLRTDASWKALVHPSFGDTDKPHPNYRLPEHNVRFDAAKDIPGWYDIGFDDAAWKPAQALGAAPAAPWNKLHVRPIRQWRWSELRDYVNDKELPAEGGGEQAIVAKLPYDAQVTPYLQVDAPAGLVIDVRTDTYKNTGDKSVRAEYVTRAGVQEFESPAWFSGHEVHYAIPAGVKVLALKYRETGYDCNFAGAWRCDDEFFNALRAKALRTLYVNMRDTYYDCPDRERAQWWGDEVIHLGLAFYALDRRSDMLARKGLLELAAWQRPDGSLYSPIPDGNWNRELPLQSLAAIGPYGAQLYYLHTGDASTIREIYPAIKRYLGVWKLGADGLVVHRAGEWDWPDWGENADVAMLDNAWYYLALKAAVDLAKVADDPDVAGYQGAMASVRAKFDKAFWNGTAYHSPGYKGATDDRANAMAVLAGLAPPERHAAVRKVLGEQFHASPYMEKYVLEALYVMGDADAAMARMRQRYQAMVDSPITTLTEFFGKGGSYNHAWSGGPLSLLAQYGAGIAPDAPAYARYHVAPQPGTLKEIDATVHSIRGEIRMSLRRDGKRLTLTLDSPKGTVATVALPVADPNRTSVTVRDREVFRHGKFVPGLHGLADCRADGKTVTLIVEPGRWTFEAVAE